MADVTLHHPKLPDQPITVDERAVPHYERSGWVAPIKTPEPAAEPAETKPAATPRKRRTAERNTK
jgi:hypothetical protein